LVLLTGLILWNTPTNHKICFSRAESFKPQSSSWSPNFVESGSKELSKNCFLLSVSKPYLFLKLITGQTRAYLSLVLRKTVNYYMVINSSLNPHRKAADLITHFRNIITNFEEKVKELKI